MGRCAIIQADGTVEWSGPEASVEWLLVDAEIDPRGVSCSGAHVLVGADEYVALHQAVNAQQESVSALWAGLIAVCAVAVVRNSPAVRAWLGGI